MNEHPVGPARMRVSPDDAAGGNRDVLSHSGLQCLHLVDSVCSTLLSRMGQLALER